MGPVIFCEAEQTLCFFFWKKKCSIEQTFEGKPSNSLDRLRRGLGSVIFCEAEQTLFASFSGKRSAPLNELIF
jgi:hypothetical protein